MLVLVLCDSSQEKGAGRDNSDIEVQSHIFPA